MWIIQRRNGASYWSENERDWDELSSATRFESKDAAWNIQKKIKGFTKDNIEIITLEEAIKNDTTPIPLREPKPLTS
jgi:hypothetical protein